MNAARTVHRTSLVAAAAAGVLLALAVPGLASAGYYGDETDYAKASGGPTGQYSCGSSTGVTICFKASDDLIYVKDTKADGYAAAADWYYSNSMRTGSCVNKLTAGTWGVCNKNFAENQIVWFDPTRYNNGQYVDDGDSFSVYA
ncbi:hypothetical protein ACFPIJ_58990 [Dactylosporangium cerinum]|uniref:Secreted protein n=1 Tax=Dactylosporangium cerinum TaxID=1434730 RepID=A0ABV9WKZ6_9ACTN